MKKPDKPISLTIGIPSYNEAKNIINLLNSLLRQKGDFNLEKIHVVCDGSEDQTPQLVKKFAQKHRLVKLSIEKIRKGKTTRLNDIYHANKSGLLLTIDADILPENNHFINELVKTMQQSNKILVVAANQKPFNDSPSFLARTLYYNSLIWNDLRVQINGGDSIYNLFGSATLIRGSFAKKIHYPITLTCDQYFLYVKAKKYQGFRLAQKATYLQRMAQTWSDFRKQDSRALNEHTILVKKFGPSVSILFYVPTILKIKTVMSHFLKNPLYTTSSVAINLLVKINKSFDPSTKKGLWEIATTTKNTITVGSVNT